MKKLLQEQINTKKLTLQYAVLQGSYWAGFCAVYAYASVLLLDKGFTSSEIGIIIAIGNILGVILQPTISGIADRSKRIKVHHLGIALTLCAIALYTMLGFTKNILLAIAALFCLTDALYQAVQPLVNSVSVYYINNKVDVNFGIARATGSVSYALVSTMVGHLVELYGTGSIIITGIILLSILVLTLLCMPLLAHEEAQSEHKVKAKFGLLAFIKQYPRFIMTLLGITLIFTFHNMTNNYMIHIASMLGGTSSNMGTALSISAVCELPTMLIFAKLIKKFDCRKLMSIALVIFAIKAVSYVFLGSITGLYLAQVLQMGGYALYLPASIYYVNSEMREQDLFKGQALMVSTSTFGGVGGSLLGGYLVDYAGTKPMIVAGAILASIGAAIACIFMKNKTN